MQSILNSLTDPAWWFTSVVVAVLIGWLTEPTRRLFLRIAAKTSDYWKARRQARLALEHRRTAMFIDNPVLLILEYIQIVFGFLLFLALMAVYAAIPLVVDASGRVPELAVMNVQNPIGRQVLQIFMILIGLTAAYVGYRVGRLLSPVYNAISELRRRQMDELLITDYERELETDV